MEFVDTHCHLNFHTYNDDIETVIDNALKVGVKHILVPGLDLATSRESVQLATRYQPVYAAVGVHPGEVDGFQEEDLPGFEELIRSPKVVAIGEIGLDYFHRKDNKREQRRIFQVFLDMAIKHKLPVILHSRDSLSDLTHLINEKMTQLSLVHLRGVYHAFEGNVEEATKAVNQGFYIGAGGPITYKNAATKHEVFSKISIENIVLETDGPFLSPQGYRGKRNEPANIPLIAERLAELQHYDIKVIANKTTDNAMKLFNWNK